MASVRYAALVSDLAGKVGGSNFQRGLASPIYRNISTRRNMARLLPVGVLVPHIRSLFRTAVSSWRTLSSSQQAAWVAVTSSFPRYNKFGTPYTPSAYQLFVELSLGLLYIGEDIVTGAPATSSFVNGAITFTYVSATPSITVSMVAPYPTAGYKVAIYCSPYISNGQGFRRSKCVSIALKSFTAGTHSYDITSNVTAIHGPIIVGTQLWFYLAQVNNVTGEINPIDPFNVFL